MKNKWMISVSFHCGGVYEKRDFELRRGVYENFMNGCRGSTKGFDPREGGI